ncbi:MAG: hypothetical protein OXI97_04255, partial [Acidimicrobiaceae bacterium]|nr:hypothetical protein [Acidimicrobiaceae bacterium]
MGIADERDATERLGDGRLDLETRSRTSALSPVRWPAAPRERATVSRAVQSHRAQIGMASMRS